MGNKFPALILIFTVLAVIGGAILLSGSQKQNITLPANYEYYWSETCPHCAKVQEFFDGWDKKDKVTIDKFEVTKDRSNSVKMAERADYCRLPRTQLGVPFLFTPDGKCISGDEPIISYFNSLNL